jgi:predicted nucleic acid-binding protein
LGAVIVLDASVLIAFLESNDVHHSRAEALLLGFAGEELSVSPITLAEILVGPARTGSLPAVTAALDQFLHVEAFGVDSPSCLALLRAETNLVLPDCCVILAAESTRAGIATFDARLAKVARTRRIPIHD